MTALPAANAWTDAGVTEGSFKTAQTDLRGYLSGLLGTDGVAATARAALASAFRNRSFMVMAGAYFVCGMQLVFLTTHLPSYLLICGLDPMLSAQTLGMIGGFIDRIAHEHLGRVGPDALDGGAHAAGRFLGAVTQPLHPVARVLLVVTRFFQRLAGYGGEFRVV